jgi:hypothetical protein
MGNVFGIDVPKGSVLILSRGLVVDKEVCGIGGVVNGIEDEGSRVDYAWENKDSYRILVEWRVNRDTGLRYFSIVRFRDKESKEMFVLKYGLMTGRKDLAMVIPGKMN